MKKQINFSPIYLQAARWVDRGEEKFSCNSVYSASTFEAQYYPDELYVKVFSEGRVFANHEWGGILDLPEEERQEIRVLMLCLMAACWRDFI